MSTPRYPSLYQINTRVWLTELSGSLGRRATLDDIPDAELDHLVELGFDWVWLLSVWQTGLASRAVSRSNPDWLREFRETLPDLREEDIPGSGFAITGYTVHEDLGGDAALARLRDRLRERGLRLMLDFVPNHMGLDHPWIEEHPEYFISGTEEDLARAPENFTRVPREKGELILAHGRDPNFAGWPDTLQLDYANASLREAMTTELVKIAGQCDGVRCDMAMLVLPRIFERTWGIQSEPFWPIAIPRVREANSNFCFLAEVYWDLEWEMIQEGFDYAYDKRLYDRLRDSRPITIQSHLRAGVDYQDRLARFLENHDEQRAALVFPSAIHKAAAVITYLSPGLRLFHQGQFLGKRKRISPHLGRGPEERIDQNIADFYESLLKILTRSAFRDGTWRLLECEPAWPENWTSDCIVAFAWEGDDEERFLVAVNFARNQSQCYLRLPFTDLSGTTWQLRDELSPDQFEREGDHLASEGLYLDMHSWQGAVYSLRARQS